MRWRIVASVASLLVTVGVLGVAATGVTDDRYDARLDDLETRVAALETQVAGPARSSQGEAGVSEPGVSSLGQQGEAGVSSQISSSSQSTTGTYSASYSSNGDRMIPFEIDDSGTYHMTVHVSSAAMVRIVADDGESVPAFEVLSNEASTATRTGELEPGDYVLEVESTSNWTVVITSATGSS